MMRGVGEAQWFGNTLLGSSLRPFMNSASRLGITERSGRITGMKVPTFRSDDENERCSVSDHPALPNDFSPSMPPYTTRSTPAAT